MCSAAFTYSLHWMPYIWDVTFKTLLRWKRMCDKSLGNRVQSFTKLISHYNKCLNVGGDYVEKQCNVMMSQCFFCHKVCVCVRGEMMPLSFRMSLRISLFLILWYFLSPNIMHRHAYFRLTHFRSVKRRFWFKLANIFKVFFKYKN